MPLAETPANVALHPAVVVCLMLAGALDKQQGDACDDLLVFEHKFPLTLLVVNRLPSFRQGLVAVKMFSVELMRSADEEVYSARCTSNC